MLTYIGLITLLTITPGADTMLVVRSVLGFGRKAGILTALGICSGLLVHATLSALGLSLILVRSAAAFTVVKLAGAEYLLYLGIASIWRAIRGTAGPNPLTPSGSAPRTGWQSLGVGLMNNLLNPKVAIFYLAFLPQFIAPGAPVLAQSLLLAGIHIVLGLIWLSLISVFLERVRGWITSPAVRRWIEGITGGILLLFGVRLAMEHG